MADPIGWVAPETGWVTGDDILNTDLVRMETNILGLRDWLKQAGNFEIVTVGLPGGEKTASVYWIKHAEGIVILKIPELLGTTNVGSPAAFSLSPVVAWPVDIRVAAAGKYTPVQTMESATSSPPANFNNRYVDGALELPYDSNTAINVKRFGLTTSVWTPNFGIYEQYLTYYTV